MKQRHSNLLRNHGDSNTMLLCESETTRNRYSRDVEIKGKEDGNIPGPNFSSQSDSEAAPESSGL